MDYSKLGIALISLLTIVTLGSLGYVYWEGMPLFEAFYMTLITISTVGFSEVKPLSMAGRWLTIFIIISGISLLSFTLGQIARVVVGGELRMILGRRKLEKQIAALSNHYIICGYGRTGTVLVNELLSAGTPLVVIELDEKRIDILAAKGILYLEGDATEDELLLNAGIIRAAGLVTTLNSDADSVFITLSARVLCSDLYILARANNNNNESKLIYAGASRVVSPHQLGGELMAEIINKPTVVDFLSYAMGNNDMALQLEEAVVGDNSAIHGKTLVESGLRRDYGVIIIAIKRRNGEMVFNPEAKEIFYSGDRIVVLGEKKKLMAMRQEI
ncbi:potassium channel protein [Desulforhopalus vacuolatus]|uniref:potassium channel family protein n=1 Tax=Desulforhopalus vacuolatus TaxID=40414 RepID=UPI0019663D0E|nr:potassium channel protein [Desulforhopalus vacuolatus]MBM9519462.1 potassium channel protein [Desulforhopalus vacuolatus]